MKTKDGPIVGIGTKVFIGLISTLVLDAVILTQEILGDGDMVSIIAFATSGVFAIAALSALLRIVNESGCLEKQKKDD